MNIFDIGKTHSWSSLSNTAPSYLDSSLVPPLTDCFAPCRHVPDTEVGVVVVVVAVVVVVVAVVVVVVVGVVVVVVAK